MFRTFVFFCFSPFLLLLVLFFVFAKVGAPVRARVRAGVHWVPGREAVPDTHRTVDSEAVGGLVFSSYFLLVGVAFDDDARR